MTAKTALVVRKGFAKPADYFAVDFVADFVDYLKIELTPRACLIYKYVVQWYDMFLNTYSIHIS
jgi:hypothetical protein